MLDETFFLDGIDARSAGICLQEPISFSDAVPVVEIQSIPGRNGDLIYDTGSYENRSGSASCFCLKNNVEKSISSAGRFLMGKKGYRRLETSDDPDHYWMARVENSPQIAMRLRTLAPFEIGFDCKPQRFVKAGENAVMFTANGSLFNQYGQIALPIVTVHYRGEVDITIGECTVKMFGLWYDENLLSEELVKYNGFRISDLKEWRVEQSGATSEQFMTALNNCNGDAIKMFNDLSEYSGVSVSSLERYIGYLDSTWIPAFSSFLSSDWENVVSLDSDIQNAYNDSGDQNHKINALSFPVLVDGENEITWVGDVRKVELIPRWWEL